MMVFKLVVQAVCISATRVDGPLVKEEKISNRTSKLVANSN